MDGDGSNGNFITAILILAFLLLLAAYFAACETAFASVARPRLRADMERGDRRAKRAIYVAENFNKAITTILICTNIVHLAAASYVTVVVTRRWGLSAVTLSTIVTTVVVFFLGEMLPKSLAKKYSERFSLWAAGSLCFLMRVLTPLSALLTAIGGAALRFTKGESEVTVTEDELHDLIETMTDEGEIGKEQGELVHNALDFGDVTAESVLTARVDLTALEVGTAPEEAVAVIRRARHSRLPVYEGTVDNIIGVLQIRKYIKAWLADREHVDMRALLDPTFFVHQSTKIDELLPVMSARKMNVAVVTDNYGGTLGVVTIEDILEELVGEIWDEEDVIVESRVKNADGSFSFAADVDMDEAFGFMDYDGLPDDPEFEHKLLGEWAYEQFDLLPRQGDSFAWGDLRVTIEQLDRRRIRKLRIETTAPAEGEEAEAE